MSEREQVTPDAPPPATSTSTGQPPPAHPAAHEASDVNLAAIVWTGVAIVAGIVVTGLVCWGLEAYYAGRQRRAAEAVPALTREVAEQSLAAQIASLPSPQPGGEERFGTRLLVRTGPGQSRAFVVGPLTRVLRSGKEVQLAAIGEGARVTVAFREDEGLAHALRVVSPPEEEAEGEQVVTGQVVGIDAQDVVVRRRVAEALLGRYEWVDREEGVARIPLEQARKAILSEGLKGKWLPARKSEKGEGEER